MPPEVRPIEENEFATFARVNVTAFGGTPPAEDVRAEARESIALDRTVAAFQEGQMVGTAASFAFDLTLPGSTTLPVAGVSWVGVLPTYRRRGVLTALMRYQLDDVRRRGEPLAMLGASESAIYGRFRYGLATTQATTSIVKGHTALGSPVEISGRLELIEKEVAAEILPPIYDRARLRQPGFVTRSPIWWKHYFVDRERWRDGASARFYVVHRGDDGTAEGYASYRFKQSWESGFPEGRVIVGDLVALTSESYLALWCYLTHIDLATTTQFTDRPLDEPIRWLLADPRRLRIETIHDFLWVRLVDPIRALSGRRYLTQDQIVFEVHDRFCPHNSGRYELAGGPDGANCRKSDAGPDIALAADDLGAVYLGGTKFTSLARAGRVVERTPGSLVRADAMFASDPPAWCSTDF